MGTRYNHLDEAVLTSTHNLSLEQKYENYENFLSESFHCLVVKFSIYLKRRVFVKTKHKLLYTSISSHEARTFWGHRKKII